MKEIREKLRSIKTAIKESAKPQFEFEPLYEQLLLWLSQFKFPAYPNAKNWQECIATFYDPSESTEKPTEGLKLRMVLKLFTNDHTYIISVIECFNKDAQGIGILCVHVNIDEIVYKLQKKIEQKYNQSFEDTLTAKQTLYVESFDSQTFFDSLTNAGIAILGNELRGETAKKELPVIKKTGPQLCQFPESE